MKEVRKTADGIKVCRTGRRFTASYPVPRTGRQFILGTYRTMDEAEHWGKVAKATCGHVVPLGGVREAMQRTRARRLEDEQAKQAEAEA